MRVLHLRRVGYPARMCPFPDFGRGGRLQKSSHGPLGKVDFSNVLGGCWLLELGF